MIIFFCRIFLEEILKLFVQHYNVIQRFGCNILIFNKLNIHGLKQSQKERLNPTSPVANF